jgi:hypothetical protein
MPRNILMGRDQRDRISARRCLMKLLLFSGSKCRIGYPSFIFCDFLLMAPFEMSTFSSYLVRVSEEYQ